ncbi:hypothetical protein HSBAA_40620 [Vreelandella sulfidaeris]|uniref:Uncharacterized protein n=1 Tax=Vreelandella sulfidaeris TaxID=115553 RepID=A0A455U992_9GAMM|nr:hypothetical protein HSBAA_40620 [Halomonas sulfidaeris]
MVDYRTYPNVCDSAGDVVKAQPTSKRHAALRSQTSKQGVSIKLEKPPFIILKAPCLLIVGTIPRKGQAPIFVGQRQ